MFRQDKPKNIIIHRSMKPVSQQNLLLAIQNYGAEDNLYDNSVIESFHAILKKEEMYSSAYQIFE